MPPREKELFDLIVRVISYLMFDTGCVGGVAEPKERLIAAFLRENGLSVGEIRELLAPSPGAVEPTRA